MKYTFALIGMWLLSFSGLAQELTSPNQDLKMKFSLNENGTPVYQLTYKDQEVIKPSTLGLELKNDDYR